jgi:hypothetical protein
MIQLWASLGPQDRETFRTIIAFLKNRLAEQGTINWALNFTPSNRIERIAIEYLLDGHTASELAEPWVSAWRLIKESWAKPLSEGRDGTAIYAIQRRLRAGDRSGAEVSAIVDLVALRLEVKPVEAWRWNFTKKPSKPKAVNDILSSRLTSGDLIDLNVLELANLDDIPFLKSLANALDAAVNEGLDIALRLGWNESRSLTGLGFLHRVYYTKAKLRDGDESEADAHHRGIAPSVKLLHAVVARIAEIQPATAQRFVSGWQSDESTIFVRLWSAMARNGEIINADLVASFLNSLDDRRFWDVRTFPEIAELRALRFGDLDEDSRKQTIARLQKGPPRNQSPKNADKANVANERLNSAARELRRIEVAGGELPASAKTWLNSRQLQFGDLTEMTIDSGFPTTTIHFVSPNPDNGYDDLQGVTRLRALETALATNLRSWDDDPAGRANAWINQPGNSEKLLADFETANNGGVDFAKVWDRFGWAHRSPKQYIDAGQDAKLAGEAGRVINLLNQLSDKTFSTAIEGICAWLDNWEKHAFKLPLALPIWLRLWPIAVSVTNLKPEENNDGELPTTKDTLNDRHGSDALNTPVGKLTGMFLSVWSTYKGPQKPFHTGGVLRQMRDTLIATDGRSGLLVRYRLIEYLPYLLNADRSWAQEHLIKPLLKGDEAALELWRAVARRTHFTDVLKIIGAKMVDLTDDRRLDRGTRSGLLFSLVIESLHAFREQRDPAVPHPRIQQKLRILDDEVRASAANVIQQFVREVSTKSASGAPEDDEEQKASASAAALFRTVAVPFLREVWPQERSLATPGVSRALADLPATSGEAFAEAVATIERFLVPFDCWSMIDYGLYGDEGGTSKLAIINGQAKAQALLKLLDLTVGTSEGAVVPNDLTNALDQIRSVAPSLVESQAFRRLSTAARR